MNKLDERGKQCPLPVIETKKELETLPEGSAVSVLVDNEIAVQNLKKLAAQKGYDFTSEKKGEKEFEAVLTVTKKSLELLAQVRSSGKEDSVSAESCSTGEDSADEKNKTNGTVVVISSDSMGEPEKELGKILLKGFLFALAKQEDHPKTILFYNGGAKLSCEGSESLEDLKALADAGTEILTCGTCLQYQNLSEKLKVGGVTNMYEITDRMTHAAKLVKPC